MTLKYFLKTMAGAAALCLAAGVLAQTTPSATATPSADDMIEQLKVPKTRSLRNLSVEAAGGKPGQPLALAAQADPTLNPRPSLSLLIQFDYNSAHVKPESQQALANLSQALQSDELKGAKFAVEGHTDASGNPALNQKLSQLRAFAVRDYLKAKGVAQDRLLPAGKGSSDLANAADPSAPENRRVRIVNLD